MKFKLGLGSSIQSASTSSKRKSSLGAYMKRRTNKNKLKKCIHGSKVDQSNSVSSKISKSFV